MSEPDPNLEPENLDELIHIYDKDDDVAPPAGTPLFERLRRWVGLSLVMIGAAMTLVGGKGIETLDNFADWKWAVGYSLLVYCGFGVFWASKWFLRW